MCDGSPYGVGAVCLKYVDEQAIERPVAYASCTLSQPEQNYSQLEKKTGFNFWYHNYLYGCSFTLYTDHKPLHARS